MNDMSSSRSLNDIIFQGIYSYKVPRRARKANSPKKRGAKPVGAYRYDAFIEIFKAVDPGADMRIAEIYKAYFGRPAPDEFHKMKRELDRTFNSFNTAKRGFLIVRGAAPHTKRMIVDDGTHLIKAYSTLPPKEMKARLERERKKLQEKSIDKWAPSPDNPEDKLGFSHLDIRVLRFL